MEGKGREYNKMMKGEWMDICDSELGEWPNQAWTYLLRTQMITLLRSGLCDLSLTSPTVNIDMSVS